MSAQKRFRPKALYKNHVQREKVYGISLLAYYLANLNLLLELSNKYSKYVLKYL